MASRIARQQYFRGRPPLAGNGSKGSIMRHSRSVRSLGYVVWFIPPLYLSPGSLYGMVCQLCDRAPDLGTESTRYCQRNGLPSDMTPIAYGDDFLNTLYFVISQ